MGTKEIDHEWESDSKESPIEKVHIEQRILTPPGGKERGKTSRVTQPVCTKRGEQKRREVFLPRRTGKKKGKTQQECGQRNTNGKKH